jgi:transcriptional regulator with GAF, ATPase, and Fis domain
MNKKLIEEFVKMVSKISEHEDLIEQTVIFIKNNIHADGLGIRLEDGPDYPYYTTLGFSDQFIKIENYLCKRDECGNIIRDKNDKPILECMCGDVLQRKDFKDCRFYSKNGSFNVEQGATKELTESIAQLSCVIRGKCLQEGYHSVALIPIPYENKNIGLIQLNSYKDFAFTSEVVETIEQIAIILGKAIGGIIVLNQKSFERKKELSKNMSVIISEIQNRSKLLLEKLEKLEKI